MRTGFAWQILDLLTLRIRFAHPLTPFDRDDIKPGMWVRFRGEKWDISTLGEYSFKRTYLGLKASLSKGVSG